MNRWKNKVAVITGASSGIGETLAEKLVETGVVVAGLARNRERLDNLSRKLEHSKGKFHGIICDVTKEKEILMAFEWIKENLGPIHILVNNAGIRRNTNLIEGDTKLWGEIFDTNVMGLCIATREAIKDMRANDIAGHIIHMNSVSGHIVNHFPQSSVYPASKFAVTALTETLRQELISIQSKIKISSVSPGFVRTGFREAAGVLETEQQKQYEASAPHLATEDVVDAVIYILSTPPHVQVHELIIKPIGESY